MHPVFDSEGLASYTADMEIHLTPELQKRLIDVATKTGRHIDDLVQEAVAGFVDELTGRCSFSNATRFISDTISTRRRWFLGKG
jgi:predicted DNA-binding protein